MNYVLRSLRAAALLATVVLATACSNSPGAPGAPSAPAPAARTVEFTSQNAAATNAVALKLKSTTPESVTFEVVLKDLTAPVAGAALEIGFDPSVVSYESVAQGSFLAGQTVVRAAVTKQPGTLVAVFTQRDLKNARSGSGALGLITFKLQPGSYSKFITLNPAASTLFGIGGVKIDGEGFVGGTLQVRG